ncbi:murein tripeptide amidase MpaA [Sodalis sp. (in: enterobacteria)]|uniref:murein tripeptide amidase MpaA n=1 Tax=Sodalis sp. (in: enterobacteria) TaxID=1898979 RepID=UPI003F2E0A59
MQPFRPRSQRGALPSLGTSYGTSVLGAPLLYHPASRGAAGHGLIIAGTHGDETASVIALSCALRTLGPEALRHALVLAVNPDGCRFGLRANARGVDLNRNFPAANWQSGETVYRWTSATQARDVALATGDQAGSEPETQALCRLIDDLRPAWVVSFHEPLACIEPAPPSPLTQRLAQTFRLPLIESVGYATPGSFGSWCADRRLPCITVELPAISADAATHDYLEAMIALLTDTDGATRS